MKRASAGFRGASSVDAVAAGKTDHLEPRPSGASGSRRIVLGIGSSPSHLLSPSPKSPTPPAAPPPSALKKLDTNNDGKLTLEGFKTGRPPRGGGPGGGPGGPGGGGPGGPGDGAPDSPK